MKLKDLDRDYRKISEKSIEERIEYCEKLISRMRGRLTDDYSDTKNIRSLILEMIGAAEEELAELRSGKN